jgi:UPF0042 nucleotide-binding protein
MLASGKSIALRVLQDLGYYCIDNLPANMIKPFIDIVNGSNPAIKKIALVVDARGEAFFSFLGEALSYLGDLGNCEVVFFDAEDEVLIQRYKLQRRRHLMAGDERVEETIRRERVMLEPLREMAHYIIDTSKLTDSLLRSKLSQLFTSGEGDLRISLIVVSFGFKHGILRDADIIMDVRFLPNPYYIEEMRLKNGLDSEVAEYVLSKEVTQSFLGRFTSLVSFLVPNYVQEGKRQLVIGIGCSGGQHRSPAIAQELARRLNENGMRALIEHRDLVKAL